MIVGSVCTVHSHNGLGFATARGAVAAAELHLEGRVALDERTGRLDVLACGELRGAA